MIFRLRYVNIMEFVLYILSNNPLTDDKCINKYHWNLILNIRY
jgi:hypothetical protein